MWTSNDIVDQTGRIVIVTGANSGIGYETALALFKAGAHVVLATRDAAKSSDALNLIQASGGKGTLETGLLDLASLSGVEAFTELIKQKYERLDLLINNAGVMTPPESKTADGFELQFGVNFLGHFALTAQLYPLLKKSPNARLLR
jgi:NAD(P)-dependent dehydrogenase (short-subunit alcohol dehydrogenase family)